MNKQEKLKYIYDTVSNFVTKEAGGWLNHEDERLQVARIPEKFAHDILDTTEDEGSEYFWGWGEKGEKNIRVYLCDVKWQLED